MKTEKTSNQTVVPLNYPTALTFLVLYNTVRNAMRFIKLRYLYMIYVTTFEVQR